MGKSGPLLGDRKVCPRLEPHAEIRNPANAQSAHGDDDYRQVETAQLSCPAPLGKSCQIVIEERSNDWSLSLNATKSRAGLWFRFASAGGARLSPGAVGMLVISE